MSTFSFLELLPDDFLGAVLSKHVHATTLFSLIVTSKSLYSRLVSQPGLVTCIFFDVKSSLYEYSSFLQRQGSIKGQEPDKKSQLYLKNLCSCLGRDSILQKIAMHSPLELIYIYPSGDDLDLLSRTSFEAYEIYRLAQASTKSIIPQPLNNIEFFPKGLISLYVQAYDINHLVPLAEFDMTTLQVKFDLHLKLSNVKSLTIIDKTSRITDNCFFPIPSSLTSLKIESQNVTSQIFDFLPPNLTKLHFYGHLEFHELTSLPKTVTNFAALVNVTDNIASFPPEFKTCFSDLQSLHLTIEHDQPVTIPDIINLPAGLTSFRFDSLDIWNHRLSMNSPIPYFPELQELFLGHFHNVTFSEAWRLLPKHKLTSVAFKSCDLLPMVLPSSITNLRVENSYTRPSRKYNGLPPNLTQLTWCSHDWDLPSGLPDALTFLKCRFNAHIANLNELNLFPKNLTHLHLVDDVRDRAQIVLTLKFLMTEFPESIKSVRFPFAVIDTQSVPLLSQSMINLGILDFVPDDPIWREKLAVKLISNRIICNPIYKFQISSDWLPLLPRNLTKISIGSEAEDWSDKELQMLPEGLKILEFPKSTRFADSSLSFLPSSIENVHFDASCDFSVCLFENAPASLKQLDIQGFNLTSELLDAKILTSVLDTTAFIDSAETLLEQMMTCLHVKFASKQHRWLDSLDDSLGLKICNNLNLTKIDLDGFHFTDKFLSLLPPNLTHLYLFNNKHITNEGFHNLSSAQCCNQLLFIRLPSNRKIFRLNSITFIPPKLLQLVLWKRIYNKRALESWRKKYGK